MRVAIFGETSQTICKEFLLLGHDAYSVDLLDTHGDPRRHIKGNMFDYLNEGWDLGIFHPTCTFLTVSNTYITRGCSKYTANEAIEQPISIMSTRYRKPDQIIQPYQFGEDASKATCLWLNGLPMLTPTLYIEPRIVNNKRRWSNQTDSGQNKLAPSIDRWQLRSKTYIGIAKARASQWSDIKQTILF